MKKTAYALAISALMFCPLQAYAGDTIEALDEGTFEVDPTFTLGNLHDGKPNVSTGISVGYGVLENYTIYAGVSYGSEDGLAGGTVGFNIESVWTAVDTDHFDMDFVADFDFDISEGYSLTPSFEFNYDLRPDQELWGIYARVGLPIYGMYDANEIMQGSSNSDAAKADLSLDLTFGTYFSFGEIFQLFIEGGFAYENLAEALGERELVDPFISLGFNAQVTPNFELVTELQFMLPPDPDDDEYEFSGAISIGGVFGIGGKSEK